MLMDHIKGKDALINPGYIDLLRAMFRHLAQVDGHSAVFLMLSGTSLPFLASGRSVAVAVTNSPVLRRNNG